MNINFNKAKWQEDSEGFYITLKTENKQQVKQFVAEMKDKVYTAELKEFKKKRSLDCNAYLWVLLQKLADVLNTSKDEVYLEMLGRYGVFTHGIYKKEFIDRIIQEWKLCKNLGEVKVNGQVGIQLQCYFGSSTYTNLEMCKLINGVVNECKDLNIDTIDNRQLDKIVKEWGI